MAQIDKFINSLFVIQEALFNQSAIQLINYQRLAGNLIHPRFVARKQLDIFQLRGG
jgi:hypothetical protein